MLEFIRMFLDLTVKFPRRMAREVLLEEYDARRAVFFFCQPVVIAWFFFKPQRAMQSEEFLDVRLVFLERREFLGPRRLRCEPGLDRRDQCCSAASSRRTWRGGGPAAARRGSPCPCRRSSNRARHHVLGLCRRLLDEDVVSVEEDSDLPPDELQALTDDGRELRA